jgi:hypothetical protein
MTSLTSDIGPFSDLPRCLSFVCNALKSGRASNANGRTKSNEQHGGRQPSSSGRKAPKFAKSIRGKLGNFRPQRGPTSEAAQCAVFASWCKSTPERSVMT